MVDYSYWKHTSQLSCKDSWKKAAGTVPLLFCALLAPIFFKSKIFLI
ncbi:hypothetical protein B4096_0927 [Heyndrickxia coagulans]|nr:hypothetical protein B4096_0927 [Heyndrickxia coagulans]